jgi:hypothetical protein
MLSKCRSPCGAIASTFFQLIAQIVEMNDILRQRLRN